MTTLTEKVYQSQKEVERLFAACAFISPRYVVEQCGWLTPETIIDLRVRKFWGLLLTGAGQTEAAFEADLVTELMTWQGDVLMFQYARDYANQIAKNTYLASISSHLGLVAGAIQSGDANIVRGIVEEMAGERPPMFDKPPTTDDIQVEFIKAVTSEGRNILTGIGGLDNNTGGLEIQTSSVLAGRPSMGKTAMELQIARNVAGPQGKKVIFFSLETNRVSLWARAACPKVGVTWMDVRAKKLNQEQEGRLLQESADLAASYEGRLMIEDKAQTTDTIWRIVANERPDLVLIDHLRRVKDKCDNEVKRQGRITEKLAEMSKELDCHVMIAAQLNRGVEMRNDKRPMLADLRDSGEIEENVDQVFMLYRDDYYNPPMQPAAYSETELWVRKFRDGVRNAMIRLRFYERRQWFEPIDA
jgi:KaiC/GvpD/RAD55 family RecA-like ATPase